jgi:hypothetical protein
VLIATHGDLRDTLQEPGEALPGRTFVRLSSVRVSDITGQWVLIALSLYSELL